MRNSWMYFDSAGDRQREREKLLNGHDQGWLRLIVIKTLDKEHPIKFVTVDHFNPTQFNTSEYHDHSTQMLEDIQDEPGGVEDVLEAHPTGIYEIVGRFFHHGESWQGYEGDWDYSFDYQIRMPKVNKTDFETALQHDANDVLRNSLLDKDMDSWHGFSAYMEPILLKKYCLEHISRYGWSNAVRNVPDKPEEIEAMYEALEALFILNTEYDHSDHIKLKQDVDRLIAEHKELFG